MGQVVRPVARRKTAERQEAHAWEVEAVRAWWEERG